MYLKDLAFRAGIISACTSAPSDSVITSALSEPPPVAPEPKAPDVSAREGPVGAAIFATAADNFTDIGIRAAVAYCMAGDPAGP